MEENRSDSVAVSQWLREKQGPPRWRLKAMIACGSLLVLAAVGYSQFFLSRPMGQGPAGPTVDSTRFTAPWSERHVQLVGIGDSVTAGLGARSPDHSYFNRLVKNPADEFPEMRGICLSRVLPHLEVENLAVSGSTSLYHLDAVRDRLARHEPDVFGLVVMTTGGNDLIHNYGRTPPREGAMYGATLAQAKPWIEAFQQRLGTMLDEIADRFPAGCEIYLGDIYDPTDGVGDAPSVYLPRWPDGLAIHSEYNRVIAECAASRPFVHVVPLHATFLGHGSHCRQFWRSTYRWEDPYYWFFANIEDPNDRGYDALRRIFLNAIVEHSVLLQRPD